MKSINRISTCKAIQTGLFFLLVSFLLAEPAIAGACKKPDFGGLFNLNTPLRVDSRRLTFARQTGEIVSLFQRHWNTYVQYDKDSAFIDINHKGGGGQVEVTICSHSGENDKGVNIMEFNLDATNKPASATKELTGIKNKYVSAILRGKRANKNYSYQIRLRRPDQGKLHQATKVSRAAVTGFADLHLHQTAELAHGGSYNPAYVHGRHDGPLEDCDGNHSRIRRVGDAGTGEHKDRPVSNATKPYRWWPHYADGAHQQSHFKDLKKAHDDGLNLIVANAVSNQALCILTSKSSVRNRQCDDMDSAKTQLKAMIDFDKEHDWYKIVKDPWQARQVISEGNMAVVLGVEVSNLMPTTHGRWRDQLDELYDMGVRTIDLAHETDSRFSGNAHQHGLFFKALNGLKSFTRPLRKALYPMYNPAKGPVDGETSKKDFELYQAVGRATAFCEKKYQDQNIECNKFGLTDEGKQFVAELIKRKMFIPLDHVSRKARREIYDLVKKQDYYPLYATHTRVDEIMHPEERKGGNGSHEYMLSNDDLMRVRRTGGMIGLRTADNAMLEIPNCINKQLTCWGSSESLAQNVCAASRTGLAMAFGNDLHGPVGGTAPRFAHGDARTHRWDYLPSACPRNVELGLVTPFGYDKENKKYQPATKTTNHLNFDVRGLAHNGHLGSLLQDMKNLGAPVSNVRMDNSAESFIRMWERQYQPSGELSDSAYRQFMGTTAKAYATPNSEPEYDPGLKKVYKDCAEKKAKGSDKCDSIADWNQMLIAARNKEDNCPVGRTYVALKDDRLFCQKVLPKAIKQADCKQEKVSGLPGNPNLLDGYCAWDQLNNIIKPHYLVRRFKEAKCPTGFALIKAKKDSLKPYCKALVAMPIASDKCDAWGGNITNAVSGYCVRNMGDYFHARKLKGFNKEGEFKCPGTLKKVEFDVNSDALYCKEAIATSVSEQNCKSKKNGKTGEVLGHCTRDYGNYTQVWKLKGYDKSGESKQTCPVGLFKVDYKDNKLFCKAAVSSKISSANCKQDKGRTSLFSGYCAWKNDYYYKVRPLSDDSSVGAPVCGSGYSYETRNPMNKDRCNKTSTVTAKLKCKLLPSDKAKNWTGPHAQKGADECRSKKNKKPKGVKCPTGYKYAQKSGADSCSKTTTDHKTPTCQTGTKYKSQKGKDACLK